MSIVLFFICLLASALYFWWIGIRILQYQEGWNTFYFSKHFVADAYYREGASVVIRVFFLQFFHDPLHGALVMSGITAVMMGLLIWAERRCVKWMRMPVISFALSLIINIFMAMFIGKMSISKAIGMQNESAWQDEQYMKLSNMVRNEQWDDVVAACDRIAPVTNLLFQNCLHMALAEKGELGDRLFDQPVMNITSIYVNEISSPQVAGLLSDVYYSMGHIAQAQRYAFEANEKMNNLSPRLLQRLIKTNIIYGQYNVAKKYLRILSKTIYYKDWCERYSTLLSDKAVESDVELSVKRKCLIADNRFSGVRGLDDDLLHVARATKGTPQCRTTLQFLGSLYILADYKEQFAAMIDEFRGTDELPSPLPDCFNRFYNHLKMSND